jgi:protein-S-isoprenylcysteine O-methyltransferase Ste14
MASDPAPISSSQGTEISASFIRATLIFERYLLPLIYVWFVCMQVHLAYGEYQNYHNPIHARLYPESFPVFCASITKYILLAVLSTFTGLALFFNRQPTHPPKSLTHITVPLAMSYYVFLYGTIGLMPLDLRENLMPVHWRVPAAAAALVISMIGYVIALWGLANLGRSFAIMVAARGMVTAGPYKYVRHPMYLGYLIELVGLLLSSFCLGMLLLGAGFVFLMVTRAQLEEERLAEAYPAYRDYMRRTGFLFPRLGA